MNLYFIEQEISVALQLQHVFNTDFLACILQPFECLQCYENIPMINWGADQHHEKWWNETEDYFKLTE